MHLHTWLRCLSLALSCTALDARAAMPTMTEGLTMLVEAGTGLRWTASDSPQELDFAGAGAYCAGLGDGWRLPTIVELERLHASSPPQLRLHGPWHWSGTAVTSGEARDYRELAWGLTMANGKRTMALAFSPFGARALCVRGS